MCKPTVPEVSIILDDTKKLDQPPAPAKSYKEWKQQHQKLHQQALNQYQKTQIKTLRQNDYEPMEKKKFVQFDLPPPPPPPAKIELIAEEPARPVDAMAVCPQLDLSLIDARTTLNSVQQNIYPNFSNGMQHSTTQWPKNDGFVKSSPANIGNLEEMYRQLSLQQTNSQSKNNMQNRRESIESKNPEITLDDVYKLLQEKLNQNNNQQPVTNYQPIAPQTFQQGPNFPNNQQFMPPQQTTAVRTTDTEPTMKDLFNIILKQQEQLMNIQQQVHSLLLNTTNSIRPAVTTPAITANTENNQIFNCNEKYSRSNQIGVMTSLEINVQQYKPCLKSSNNEISLNKIDEQKMIKQCGCNCNCEKPNQQMVISSDSDSNDDNSDSFTKSGVKKSGWTFYGNILNQVNDVLQNTSPENQNVRNKPQMNIVNDVVAQDSNAKPNIRSTQIKQVGLQFDDVNISAMAKR